MKEKKSPLNAKDAAIPENGNGSPLLVDRVEHALRKRVAQMLAASETMLPQEMELAKTYGVSIKTVRFAMRRLKDDHLVRAVSGKGTFVVPAEKRLAPVIVLCSGIKHPHAALCTEVASTLLRERRQASHFCFYEDVERDWELISSTVQAARCILITGVHTKQNLSKLLTRIAKPAVLIGDPVDSSVREPLGCCNIVNDSRAPAFLATRHLLSQGHRRILLIGWLPDTCWARERMRGHREAFESAGIPFDESLVVKLPHVTRWQGADPVGYDELQQNTAKEIKKLLSGTDVPTAVVHDSASESLTRNILARWFPKLFTDDRILITTTAENLEREFHGEKDLTAVGYSMRGLTERALDLLTDNRTGVLRPSLEIIDYSSMYQRHNGQWRQIS